MVTRRPLRLLIASLALILAPYAAQAACSAAPTDATTDGILNFTSNPPAYGQVVGIAPINGSLVYDGTNKLFKYCDGTNWVTLGATGTAAGSTGYVQFNTSGSLDSDSNFYWDKTNHRLGIGTTTAPTQSLSVYGSANFIGTGGIASRGLIGTPSWDASYFSFQNATLAESAANSALNQNSVGDTTVNAASGKTLFLRNNNSTVAVVTGTGFGIGTTAPQQKLDVAGTYGDSTEGSPLVLRTLDSLGAAGVNIQFAAKGASNSLPNYLAAITGIVETGNVDGRLEFRTSNDGTWTTSPLTSSDTKMTIKATGNVGIGTTSPASILDVQASLPMLRLLATTGTNFSLINFHNTGGDFYIGRENSAGGSATGSLPYAGVVDVATAHALQFATNATVRATIDTSGNVGIGTTTVNATLDVNGYAKLKKNSSAPVTCSATYGGSLAVTSASKLCMCNGTSWVEVNSATSCTW